MPPLPRHPEVVSEHVMTPARHVELYGLYLDFMRRVCQSNQGLERGR